jgi:hypothetical protein
VAGTALVKAVRKIAFSRATVLMQANEAQEKTPTGTVRVFR